jgi:hypothetical protein
VIAALAKAESLYKFAQSQGAPVNTFVLVLSDSEGLELLDWFKPQFEQNEVFDLDLEAAHKSGNPWAMLPGFEVLGLAIARVEQLH